MATSNPYALTSHSDPRITYEGLRDSRYCFRVDFGVRRGLDTLTLKHKIFTWIMSEASGDPRFGNHFGTQSIDPKADFVNPTGADYFVLFDRLSDITLFETVFPIIGFSPSGKPLQGIA